MTFDEAIEHTIKEMYKDRHSNIASILRPIYLKSISDNEEYHKKKDRVIEIMGNKGLIRNMNSTFHTLTDFGREIHEDGGWLKYLADKAQEKEMQRELIDSSIRTNKLQRPLLWFTVGFSAATFIATIISMIITFKDYRVHQQELQLEQKKSLENQDKVEPPKKIKGTVDPNQDSSANSAADSLGQKIK